MNTPPTDNPVLSGPVWPTFLHYALPSVAGLLALTTANIVDGLFIGNFAGAEALAALNLLIPYFTLLFGLALMLAIGGTVMAGKLLGQQQPDQAATLFSQCLLATVALGLIAAVLSLSLEEPLFRALGAEPELFPLMQSYFRIITWGLVLQISGVVLYYFVRVDGYPGLATLALAVGAGTNIVLDMVLVAGFDLGLSGAAIATALAAVLQLLVLMHYFRGDHRLRLSLPRRGWRRLGRAAYNGLSEWINEASVGVVMLLINWLLMRQHGVDGVAAFTVVNYLIFLSLMVFYGIADAMNVLVSHNLGAGQADRIRRFMISGATTIGGLSVLLLLALWLFADGLITLFLDPSDVHAGDLATAFLAVLWPLFVVNGFNVLVSVYLTAMHQPLPSAAIALSRSLVLPAALLLVLGWWLPQWPLLLALPLAEWLTFVLALACLARFRPGRVIAADRPVAKAAGSA